LQHAPQPEGQNKFSRPRLLKVWPEIQGNQ
jgi:hypothetical protein